MFVEGPVSEACLKEAKNLIFIFVNLNDSRCCQLIRMIMTESDTRQDDLGVTASRKGIKNGLVLFYKSMKIKHSTSTLCWTRCVTVPPTWGYGTPLAAQSKSWLRKYTSVRKYDPARVTQCRWYRWVGILDPRSRWIPPLGQVGTPDPMGISTKSNLYTYIHSTVCQQTRLPSSTHQRILLWQPPEQICPTIFAVDLTTEGIGNKDGPGAGGLQARGEMLHAINSSIRPI